MLGGAVFIAMTGGLLLLFHKDSGSLWWSMMGSKTVLLCVALSIFTYVSWWLWPERLFASPKELPAL